MPVINYITESLGNQSNCWVVGSGFSKAGFRLERYSWVDGLDNPASGLRYPTTVVSGFIQSGLTYENDLGSATLKYNLQSNTDDTFVHNDSTVSFRNQHYTSILNPIYRLAAFNTSEGSGNSPWVNRPEIYWVESDIIQKNRMYKINGRNLYHKKFSVAGGTIIDSRNGNLSDSAYYPLIYLAPTGTNGSILYRCSNIGPDGADQEIHEEDWYAYTNFVVPTGVPDGTYNLYYYGRWNKANIAVYSGVKIYTTPPTPSSIIFNTSDYFTPSKSQNRSQQIQNLIFIAASSILANPNTIAEINFEAERYRLDNMIVVTSGVYLIGNNTTFDVSPDINYNVIYTNSIPSRFNGVQTYNSTFYGAIRLTEYCGIEGFHINFGNEKMAPDYGILLRKHLISNEKTWGGNVSIIDCKLHSLYKTAHTLIYHDNAFWENVKIEDNDFYCYYGIGGYKDITGTTGNKRKWSIQRNTFTGNSNRAGGNAIGGIGSCSIITGNIIRNFLRGIIHSHTNGPCNFNLINNNNFLDGAEVFNSSENLLFETTSSTRYFGYPTQITPSSLRVPFELWSRYTSGATVLYSSGINSAADYNIVVKDGPGKGQVAMVTGNTSDGLIYFKPNLNLGSGSLISIGYGTCFNNICSNRFSDSLGGLEFYGRAVNNYVSLNEFIRSGRGWYMYGATTEDVAAQATGPPKNDILWYNAATSNIFYDSQICFDTPRISGYNMPTSVSGVDIISYNNFNKCLMVDSSISYNGRFTRTSTGDDLYHTALASSLKPSWSFNSFSQMLFDTMSWRSMGVKVLTISPFNLPPHSTSGLVTTGWFSSTVKNTISVNGVTTSINSGVKYLQGQVGQGVRKWNWA